MHPWHRVAFQRDLGTVGHGDMGGDTKGRQAGGDDMGDVAGCIGQRLWQGAAALENNLVQMGGQGHHHAGQGHQQNKGAMAKVQGGGLGPRAGAGGAEAGGAEAEGAADQGLGGYSPTRRHVVISRRNLSGSVFGRARNMVEPTNRFNRIRAARSQCRTTRAG